MPKSLNPVQSQAYEAPQPQIQSFVKARRKTTVEMVEDALMGLHNVKGVSLKRIYSYLLDTYNLELISKTRESLIKKYLKSLWESKDIANTTGRGLSGRFKLVNKQMFSRKIRTSRNKPRNILNASKKSKVSVKLGFRISNSKQNNRSPSKAKNSKKKQPFISRQATPVPLNLNKSSIFDTPMVPTQVQASTPFISSLVPRAPKVRKRVHKTRKETLPLDGSDTPRSSLTKKKT